MIVTVKVAVYVPAYASEGIESVIAGVTLYEPIPDPESAVINVAASEIPEKTWLSPSFTPSAFPEIIFKDPGFIVRFETEIVWAPEQQVKSETETVTLQPVPKPRLSMIEISPKDPVEDWEAPSSVTAEIVAREGFEIESVP